MGKAGQNSKLRTVYPSGLRGKKKNSMKVMSNSCYTDGRAPLANVCWERVSDSRPDIPTL